MHVLKLSKLNKYIYKILTLLQTVTFGNRTIFDDSFVGLIWLGYWKYLNICYQII